MRLDEEQNILERISPGEGIFAIHGNLDGEKESDFQEREQFIGLVVGSEGFLMPIAEVREIIMLPPITFVPNSASFVDGVINLRGTIIPALNMRKMMGFPRAASDGAAKPGNSSARIIITKYESISFGLIVDGITYVVALLPNEIETQTLPGKGTGAEFIGSIAKQGAKVQGILDVQRILKHTNVDLTDESEGEGGGSSHHDAA